MSKAPYPGYPPSYSVIPILGGHQRTCLVIELLSGGLSTTDLTHISEQLEAFLLGRFKSVIEKVKVVTPEQFDGLLLRGLRLPQ